MRGASPRRSLSGGVRCGLGSLARLTALPEQITVRRLGRPPDSSSAETRARILDAARRCFADLGYGATTNKDLANRAGYTTGAIYHYFGSKRELFVAVFNEVQDDVYDRFESAVAPHQTFVSKIDAVLDAAVAMNRHDPTLAVFLGSARIDIPRHRDLSAVLSGHNGRRRSFFEKLVDTGIATGEIAPDDKRTMLDVIAAILVGLVSESSNDPVVHERTVDGVKRLVGRTLVRPISR